MALPQYGTHRLAMRVLDHSSAANPWRSAAATEVEDSIKHEPTDAERARTVLGNNRSAVLGVAIGDSPLGFAVPYAVDEIGVPLVGIRAGIEKSLRMTFETQVCLAVAETPLTASHSGSPGGVSVLAKAIPIGGSDLAAALALFVRTQPAETSAVKRGSSKLFRLHPSVILVASGSGEISRVDIEEYTTSSSDPLAAVAPGLVAHLANDEHGSLVLLCRAYGGLHKTKSAELVAIDQYGMDLFATTDSGRQAVRIAFSHAVSSPDDVRRELTAMAPWRPLQTWRWLTFSALIANDVPAEQGSASSFAGGRGAHGCRVATRKSDSESAGSK